MTSSSMSTTPVINSFEGENQPGHDIEEIMCEGFLDAKSHHPGKIEGAESNIINDNNAGIVVENGDDQSFKNAAEDLLDKEIRDQKSIGSSSLVDKIFSVNVAAEKILAKNQ